MYALYTVHAYYKHRMCTKCMVDDIMSFTVTSVAANNSTCYFIHTNYTLLEFYNRLLIESTKQKFHPQNICHNPTESPVIKCTTLTTPTSQTNH